MSRLAVRDFGTALNFDGSSSVVTSSSSVTLGSGNCLMFRFKPKTLATSWLTSRNLAVDPGDSFRMRMDASGTISLFWENVEATSTNAKTTTAKVNVGSWNYLAVYTTGSTICIYLNGTLLTSPINGTLRAASGLQWGKSYIGQYGTFIGDDLYYFNSYTPTQSDLDNFYYGHAVPSGATLIWKCDEGSGTTALDSSGNGNDGTITGATYTSDVPMKARTVVPTTPQAALRFSGSTDNVSIPHNSSLNLGAAFTVFARIKPNPSTGFGRILEKSEAGGYSFLIEGGGANTGQMSATINGTTYRSGASFAPFTASGSASQAWSSVGYVLSGGTLTFYVNGAVLGTAAAVPTPTANTNNLILGNRAALDRAWNGGLKGVRIFSGRALSSDEIAALHCNASTSRSGLVGEYLMNEGAGTKANDTSGYGNHGTITGATFTKDAPFQPRALVGGNLVLNGDFEYAPPFTAATTASFRWIDGTAAGSTTNSTFGWGTYFEFSGSANYDSTVRANGSYSIKLSAVGSPPSSNHRVDANTDASSALVPEFGIPVVAGTAYILTYKMKTFAVTNSNGNGARLRVATSAADGSSRVYTDGPYIAGTTDFTSYAVSFTPTTGQVFLKIQCEIRGEQGTAWFDDIVLKPTLPVTRALAGARALA